MQVFDILQHVEFVQLPEEALDVGRGGDAAAILATNKRASRSRAYIVETTASAYPRSTGFEPLLFSYGT